MRNRTGNIIKPIKRDYASELTYADLVKMGVTAVDPVNARVFGDKGELRPVINNKGYFMINLYELDSSGNRIKIAIRRQFKGCKHISDSWCYKMRTVGLHRLIWAWTYGKVEAGYVVDHINNKHDTLEDYTITNLQLLTPAENLYKEYDKTEPTIYKPARNKGIEYYQEKLENYTKLYEQAKKNHNAEEAHRLRSNIANNRAKLNYLIKQNKEAYNKAYEKVNEIIK